MNYQTAAAAKIIFQLQTHWIEALKQPEFWYALLFTAGILGTLKALKIFLKRIMYSKNSTKLSKKKGAIHERRNHWRK